MRIRIPRRCSPLQMYRMGRKDERRMSSSEDPAPCSKGGPVMLTGPIVAFSMNAAEAVGVVGPVGFVSVRGPSIFLAEGKGRVVLLGCIYPGCEGSGASPFSSGGREYRLLLGAGGIPEAAEVLFDFPESSFAIGNDGNMVSPCVSGRANGVSQSAPNGPEGVPVVTSDVVDSESVGNSWDFRMLGKKYPFLSRMGAMGS